MKLKNKMENTQYVMNSLCAILDRAYIILDRRRHQLAKEIAILQCSERGREPPKLRALREDYTEVCGLQWEVLMDGVNLTYLTY